MRRRVVKIFNPGVIQIALRRRCRLKRRTPAHRVLSIAPQPRDQMTSFFDELPFTPPLFTTAKGDAVVHLTVRSEHVVARARGADGDHRSGGPSQHLADADSDAATASR